MDSSILVVDDDSAFRGLAVRLLESRGFEIVGEAATVEEGMSRALELRPDGVLVDVRLPDGSGIVLARALAGLPWAPRVLVTSSDSEAANEMPAGANGGVLAFVSKDALPDAPLVHLLGPGSEA